MMAAMKDRRLIFARRGNVIEYDGLRLVLRAAIESRQSPGYVSGAERAVVRIDGYVAAASRGGNQGPHTRARLSRKALPITETELKLIAAAAIIGLSRIPNHG